MRGRVTLLLLSSFLFPAAVLPQCDYRLEHSAPLRTTWFDVALEGNDLWAATGYGVQLLDRTTDPPRHVALLAVPGITRAIDVRGGVVYAGSGKAIYIVRRNGNGLEIVSGSDVAGGVNDVVATNGALFVATENGLVAFDRRDPLTLASPVVLTTSSSNVLSLARNGESEILAADGDSSVERFTVASASVTPAAPLAGLDRSLSVAVAGQRIFVSDGQRTRIYSAAGAAAGTAPVSAASAIAIAGDVFLIAGTDRRFRAVDLRLPEQPVELFAADIIPSGGTVNRIGGLAAADERLYVAGGDAGLLTLDTTGFTAPFPLRRQTFAALGSLTDAGAAVFAAKTAGGITELTRFSSGLLAEANTWAAESIHTIHDHRDDVLLTSSGSTLTFWSPKPVPSPIRSVSLSGAVRAALLGGNGSAVVLLEEGSVWSVSGQGAATPANVPAALFAARSGSGVALAALNDNGTTEIRFYGEGGFAAAPVTAAIPGAATAMAMSGSRVAVFTFRGITVIDFSSTPPTEVLLPQSNTALVRGLAIAGNALVDVTPAQLRVWDLNTARLSRSFALPAEALGVAHHPTAATATVLHADGVTTIDYETPARQPTQIAVSGSNRYPREAVAAGDRLFVFDGQTIEIYRTGSSSAPRFTGSIAAPGALDLAATPSMLFVLFGSGAVTAYTHHGTPLRSTTIDEGSDAVPQSIVAAGGAPWVSILRGCVTTGCEKRTIVLDPASLVRTATLEGGINDLAVSGTFANGLVDLLTATELRSWNIADALHPVLVASRPADHSAAAVAAEGPTVYTLGTRVAGYSQGSLAPAGEFLSLPQPTGAADIAIDGSCVVITGSSVAAAVHERTSWSRTGQLSLPGSARGIVVSGGRVVILTDYSIEIWSRLAATNPTRRRAAGH